MKYILITSLIVIFYSDVFSQTDFDYQTIDKIEISKEINKEDFSKYSNQVGTFQMLFSSSFLFYKKYISSQDIGDCPFHPSCSEYFIQSIQKKGVILGFLNGFDRYKRCNGYDMDKYDRDIKSGYYIDLIE